MKTTETVSYNAEVDLVVALARVLRPKVIVEVGVLYAETTVRLAEACPEAVVYGLELNIQPEARANIAASWAAERIELIEGDSRQTVNSLPDQIDFAYIDGNHAYEVAKADGSAIWAKMRAGGIIAFHDVDKPANDYLPGPGPYVREAHPDAIWTSYGEGLAFAQKR